MTNLDLKVLLFFLASYKTLALCGHPVIEKMQKIIMYDTLFAFFDEQKLVILASRLRWEEVRAILEGFINLGHKYSFKSWLCSCEDEFQKNSKLTGPALGVNIYVPDPKNTIFQSFLATLYSRYLLAHPVCDHLNYFPWKV